MASWGDDSLPAPPHSLAAERAVLGSVFIAPRCMGRLAKTLEVDDFFLPAHRHVYEAMLDVLAAGKPCDPVLVEAALMARETVKATGGLAFLMELAGCVPTSENIGHYARTVKEKAALRRLISTCAMIQSRAYGGFGDYGAFIEETKAALLKELDTPPAQKLRGVG